MEIIRTKPAPALPIPSRQTKPDLIEESQDYPEEYHPWGGYLPFPPAECVNQARSFVDPTSGIRWLQNSFCSKEKCSSGPCPRRRAYQARGYEEYWKEMRRLTNARRIFEGRKPLAEDAWEGKGL